MPKYALGYFDARGAGETARYLFALAGVDYEDLRFSREKFREEIKPKTPFGVAPFLEVDGQMISDSGAINRYLAKEFGYMGSSNMEEALINQTVGIIGDVMQGMAKFFYIPDEKEKEAAMKKFYEETVSKFYTYLEKTLQNSKSGFLVGDKVTLADIHTLACLEYLNRETANTAVVNFYDMIRSVPQIKAWIDKRPVTQF